MPRNRMIRPEFWSDGKICRLSRDARLLYIGLWNFADDQGRLEDDPQEIKNHIFPGDSDMDSTTVRRLLDELSTSARITRFSRDGHEFMFIPHFLQHQRIDRPRKSTIPDPFESISTNTRRILDDSSATKIKLNRIEIEEKPPVPPGGSAAASKGVNDEDLATFTRLWEANMGMIGPGQSDNLKFAIKEYGPLLCDAAIKECIKAGVRTYRYFEGICERHHNAGTIPGDRALKGDYNPHAVPR